jgi:hypothetical protein
MHGTTRIVVHAARTKPGYAFMKFRSSPIKTATAAYTVAIRFYRIRIRLFKNLNGPLYTTYRTIQHRIRISKNSILLL